MVLITGGIIDDEVIISRKMKIGKKDNCCLESFFLLKNKITNNVQKYCNNYGQVPKFEAGLHGGMRLLPARWVI